MARFEPFSHLWVDMATRLGLDVICCDVPWGEGIPLDQYARHLVEDPSIRAVFVTHNQTATGVTFDVAGVRRAIDQAGSLALLFVDRVSSIASIDFQQRAWGVDLAVSGSQKGLMLPPGLAVLSVSPRALAAHADLGTGGMARCYFSFSDTIASNAGNPGSSRGRDHAGADRVRARGSHPGTASGRCHSVAGHRG